MLKTNGSSSRQHSAPMPAWTTSSFLFLAVFPDRAEHDGLTEKQIRETLTRRFNDILYRTDRGYAPCIAEKRNEYQQAFTSAFAVLNPLALMNFYEQTFTDPKSKPSDKFKAINDAEKLNARLFPPRKSRHNAETQRQQTMLEKEAKIKRHGLWERVSRKRFHAVYDTLPETLQKEIKNCPDGYSEWELMEDVLERDAMTQQRKAMESDLPDDWAEFLSDVAILEISDSFSNGGLDEMTPDEVDALIHSYLDRERKAAINALKLP